MGVGSRVIVAGPTGSAQFGRVGTVEAVRTDKVAVRRRGRPAAVVDVTVCEVTLDDEAPRRRNFNQSDLKAE